MTERDLYLKGVPEYHVIFAQRHSVEIGTHLARSTQFIIDKDFSDKELSWLLNPIIQSDLAVSSVDISDNRSGLVSISDSSGKRKIEVTMKPSDTADPKLNYFSPSAKVLFYGDTYKSIADLVFSDSYNLSKRFFELSFFVDRNGKVIAEKAAADQLNTRGVWSQAEITTMAEKIHPKQGIENKRLSYTSSKDPMLPFDVVSASSNGKYLVLDPNRPQPLPKYSGDVSTITFVSTRGKVTIRSEFTYTK